MIRFPAQAAAAILGSFLVSSAGADGKIESTLPPLPISSDD
jgi:hypothetical protein